jgi:ABC-type uncharacterized transport system permease subunit
MTIVLIALAAYLVATGILLRAVLAGRGTRGWEAIAVVAILCHAATHVLSWRQGGGPDMHFFAAISLVGLGMALLTTLLAMRDRMPALGVVVLPIAALSLLAYALYGHRPAPPLDWRLQLHAWCALLAYATLAVAALLAIMLWLQERALRRHQRNALLRALPPLTELETLLFRTIAVGFALLTLTLVTGVLFVENLFAQHLVHKTVLSLLSWLVFGGLLLGRWRRGWRGSIAVRWTLVAMGLLLLAFFGSQFVLELLLHKE